MEIKQAIVISVQKGDHFFSFTMPVGSSWGNALDASFDILSEVNKLSQQAVSSAQPSICEQEKEA